jgi:tRNA threonylcarbamoyladenosine biosynthesis protein TsaE
MSKIEKFIVNNAKETLALGEKLAERYSGGTVLALYGDLGAGKTCLTQGLARGWKAVGRVNSPTFNIMKLYCLRQGTAKQLCHIDAYRLNSGDDLRAIGFDDYLADKNNVIVIEWPEKVESILPERTIKIYLKLYRGGREITVV